jgi:hypothetical protein
MLSLHRTEQTKQRENRKGAGRGVVYMRQSSSSYVSPSYTGFHLIEGVVEEDKFGEWQSRRMTQKYGSAVVAKGDGVFCEGCGRVVRFVGRLVEEMGATGSTSKSDNLGVAPDKR